MSSIGLPEIELYLVAADCTLIEEEIWQCACSLLSVPLVAAFIREGAISKWNRGRIRFQDRYSNLQVQQGRTTLFTQKTSLCSLLIHD